MLLQDVSEFAPSGGFLGRFLTKFQVSVRILTKGPPLNQWTMDGTHKATRGDMRTHEQGLGFFYVVCASSYVLCVLVHLLISAWACLLLSLAVPLPPSPSLPRFVSVSVSLSLCLSLFASLLLLSSSLSLSLSLSQEPFRWRVGIEEGCRLRFQKMQGTTHKHIRSTYSNAGPRHYVHGTMCLRFRMYDVGRGARSSRTFTNPVHLSSLQLHFAGVVFASELCASFWLGLFFAS